jgi:hypothetical protein
LAIFRLPASFFKDAQRRAESPAELLCIGGIGSAVWAQITARMQLQSEFNFLAGGTDAGYAQWVVVRQLASDEAARKLNLPVGREAEVWLRGGIRLRGKLRLLNELLFVEESQVRNLSLTVDGVPFTYAEIESCVTLD